MVWKAEVEHLAMKMARLKAEMTGVEGTKSEQFTFLPVGTYAEVSEGVQDVKMVWQVFVGKV